MAKEALNKHIEVVGWFQPHAPVNWDGMIADPKTGELVKEPSMTKQSFKDECDINNIVKRYEATGIIDHLNIKAREGVYTDLPPPIDFQGALNTVMRAQEAFDALPAGIRARFDNDPERFLAFVGDPKNQDQLIEMGLAVDTRPPKAPTQDPPREPIKPVEPPKT